MKPAIVYSEIAELTAAIHGRQVSPVEVVQAHIERAAALDPALRALVHFEPEQALAAARAAEAALMHRTRSNEGAKPLHGIPVTVKSCIDVAGWRCPAGSLLRQDYVAATDAVLVARLKAAGAIVLASTNTPEFLMAYETSNLVTGRTSNPWNTEFSAGGSSGGEAAAIAAGYSMGGVGSDGGGSIRVPAHFCGICGLRPTPGRVPSTGHFPPGAGALAWLGTVGPMARTVRDVRALFTVLAGPDPGDALSAPVAARSYSKTDLGAMRVGILETDSCGPVSAETAEAVRRAAALFESTGISVESVRLAGLDRALEQWWFFFGPVVAHLFAPLIAGHEDHLSPVFRDYLAATREVNGGDFSLDTFLNACAERDVLRASLLRQTEKYSALLSPVSAGPAFGHQEGTWKQGGYRDTMCFSQWLNLAGFPGLAVPMSISPQGLPIGAQLIGKPHEEELLLALGEALEAARGPWQRPPDVTRQTVAGP
jgi:Asp-tRNA(Asn)/Glu-tRNA(Gln) amidotransferase A subunit family amidase